MLTTKPPTSAPSRDQPRQPTPSLPTPTRALPPNLTIEPLTPPHLPPFRRLTSLLLPIRYPDKFYTEALTDPTTTSLTRVAIWRDTPRPTKRKRTTANRNDDNSAEPTETPEHEQGKAIGGIRCRLETVRPPASAPEGTRVEKRVYVQTLCVLAPYRGLGIGAAMLEAVVRVGVRRYGVTEVYAHVWEANAEALEWYIGRGFEVGELEVGYYRRLTPAGARVVRRGLGVGDYLAAGLCLGDWGGEAGGGGEGAGAKAQLVDAGD